MREIGSEFWDVPTGKIKKQLFPDSVEWYLSGRSALQAIIKDLGRVKSVALPSWCCDSMIKPFVNAGMEVHFYPVYMCNHLIQEISFECDVLLLMDYFGYTSSQPYLNGYEGTVIRDVTHSFFSSQYYDADYYFGSLRKWCGIWTGGYAWTRDGHRLLEGTIENSNYIALRKNAMQSKSDYIDGLKKDKDHLKTFYDAEKILESVGISAAAERDVLLAQKIDIEKIKIKRRANAEVLRSAFKDMLVFTEMSSDDCPMFVPLLVPNGMRDHLKRFLIEQDIYCPVHWPVSNYHILDDRTKKIYENELSLICDQRYSEEDMEQIVKKIKTFFRRHDGVYSI